MNWLAIVALHFSSLVNHYTICRGSGPVAIGPAGRQASLQQGDIGPGHGIAGLLRDVQANHAVVEPDTYQYGLIVPRTPRVK
jgi:hypothetical protein